MFSPEVIARSDRSPFPIPRRVLIALVNARTRKTVRDEQLHLDAKVYAERD